MSSYAAQQRIETPTSDAVNLQLERIFLTPYFSKSEILKRILAFITQETLMNRANCLKEYTIAVNVLGKPVSFKPQENGIVRIHAARLRRALGQYYKQQGAEDQIVIQIPKGKYVPLFFDRNSQESEEELSTVLEDPNTKETVEENITLAILPFLTTSTETHNAFVDGLCMQLSSMLMRVDHISVLAYNAVKNRVNHEDDYIELKAPLRSNYQITGCVQYTKDKVRVNIQLAECKGFRATWSETYERKLTRTNTFAVQDEICQRACSKIEEMTRGKYITDNYVVPISSAV